METPTFQILPKSFLRSHKVDFQMRQYRSKTGIYMLPEVMYRGHVTCLMTSENDML